MVEADVQNEASLENAFSKIKLIQEFIKVREKEIDIYNSKLEIDKSVLVNGRNLTYLGLFRNYIEKYLDNAEFINNNANPSQ